MGIISSIYNSGYNIKRLFLGEQELKLAYLGEQIVFNEVIDDLNYVLYEFYKGKVISNTIEAPVKSAILSGNTLVNLNNYNIGYKGFSEVDGTEISFTNNGTNLPFINLMTPYTLKSSTRYTVIFDVIDNPLGFGVVFYHQKNATLGSVVKPIAKNQIGLFKFTLDTNEKESDCLRIALSATEVVDNTKIKNIVILEGDYTNINISYFEGMQSVKMPVLTTSNEDGTKTNILTTSEDVVLRGIGDVKDELDLITGEVTERIGEVVLDGSENWFRYDGYGVDGYSAFITTMPSLNNLYDTNVMCFISCDFPTGTWSEYKGGTVKELVWNHDPNKIGIRVKSEKASNVEEIKEFLSTNNIRINYKLATESVKTVDLTMVDQDEQTISKLNSFNRTTHVSTEVAENSIYPTIAIEVATE